MRAHQRLLVGLVVLAVGLTAGAVRGEKDKDSTSAKLVGKWASAGPKVPEKVNLEFMKDGKVRVTVEMEVTKKGATKPEIRKEVMDGTYKVEGNKLTITVKKDGKDDTHTFMIKSLTDKVLITGDDKERAEFRRQ